MEKTISEVFGHKVRVRACGLCLHDDRLLMVNHLGLGQPNFWAPPGGGVDFGFSIEDTIRKEFQEETNLLVTPGAFLFGCEYINPPLHSIELFHRVHHVGGELIAGFDPELQIIQQVKFLSWPAIMDIPPAQRHGIFSKVNSLADLLSLKGFYRL